MKLVAIGWGVILVAGAAWALAKGAPTAREQTSITQALPVVDAALTAIADAATSDGLAVVSISDRERSSCSVSVFLDGARYQRTLTAVVTPGTEGALLGRVADRLPADYQASVRTGLQPVFSADAGLFVAITGLVSAPGEVNFVADTGDCRRDGDGASGDGASGAQSSTGASAAAGAISAAADAALSRLAISPQRSASHRLDCSAGQSVTTLELTGYAGVEPGRLLASLGGRKLSGLGAAVVAMPDVVAYYADRVGVTVRNRKSGVVVTATVAAAC